MALTDGPDEACTCKESVSDLDELDSPDSLFDGEPIRDRLLDVVKGLRTPTKVPVMAELDDCDTETAVITWDRSPRWGCSIVTAAARCDTKQ